VKMVPGRKEKLRERGAYNGPKTDKTRMRGEKDGNPGIRVGDGLAKGAFVAKEGGGCHATSQSTLRKADKKHKGSDGANFDLRERSQKSPGAVDQKTCSGKKRHDAEGRKNEARPHARKKKEKDHFGRKKGEANRGKKPRGGGVLIGKEKKS